MLIGEALQGRYDSILFSEAAVPQSLVRVVNASPDAPALRVFLDDTPLLESISAGETTSDFLPVIARRYTLSITTADAATPDDAANPPLYHAEVNFPINARAELVIVGRLDSMQAGLYPLNTDPVGESQARLTIIHAIPGQGILRPQISSIVRQTQTVDLVETTDAPLRLEIAFGTAMRSLLIQSGAQTIGFLRVDSTGSEEFLFESEELLLVEGFSYSLIVAGRRGENSILLSTPIQVETLEEQREAFVLERSQVRFINILRDSQPITIYVNDELLIENLTARSTSPLEPFPLKRDVPVEVRDASGGVLVETTKFMDDDEALTFLVYGAPGAVDVAALGLEFLEIPNGMARARFFNGMYRTGDITMSYTPVLEKIDDPLTNPDEEADAPPPQNYDIGDTIPYGEGASVDIQEGSFLFNFYNR